MSLPPGVQRGVEMHGLAVEQDLAGVRHDRAGERLDQRRLARAVVTDDRQHLLGAQLEVGTGQGGDVAVVLHEPRGLEDRRAVVGGRAAVAFLHSGHCCLLRASWSTATATITRMPVISTW
jgi:hypothetical protein